MIHVGQNLVNFVAGTAVWFLLGSLNLAGAAGRAGRDCATLYPHCPDWEAMRAVEAVLYTPARLLLAKYI